MRAWEEEEEVEAEVKAEAEAEVEVEVEAEEAAMVALLAKLIADRQVVIGGGLGGYGGPAEPMRKECD